MRWTAKWFGTAFLLSLSGCGSRPSAVSDLANATWRIDSVPYLDIGGGPDDTLALIGFAQGVASVGDSEVVVADRDHHQLRYFNLAGEVVRTVGREGEGPGEYRYLYLLRRCGDSLHVSDINRGLWNVYSADGTYVRNYPDQSPRTVATPTFTLACNPDGLFVRYPYPFTDAQEIVKLRPAVPIWLANASGEMVADLGDFPGPEVLARPWRSWSPHPLGKVTTIAIGRNRAYVGLADSSVVLTYRLDGTLLASIDTRSPPRVVTEADREHYRWLDTIGRKDRSPDKSRARWNEFEFPLRLPAYTAMLVDAEDLLWVRGFPRGPSPTVRWTAFSEIGTLVGSVDLPTALEVFEIGVDFVLGIETLLHDGSQRVRGYRLHR